MEKKCDGCCKKVDTKIDLLFGLISNQILVAESLGSLQQTKQLITVMMNSDDKEKVKDEIERAKEQVKQIEEQIKVYRDSTLKVIAIYNNVFGKEADENISELIKDLEETKSEESKEDKKD